jgi:hypothetical protein
MENDLQVNYDALCYIAFKNIHFLTDGANRIVLRNFDWNNTEHKFVVAIISACYSLLDNRKIAIDVGPLTRGAIARRFPAFGRIGKPREDETKFVDVPELLEKMRGYANELCGEQFIFGDIYNAYYSGKE